MTVLLVVGALLVALGAFLVATAIPWPLDLIVALTLALVVAVVGARELRRRVHHLADDVGRWLGGGRHEPVRVRGGEAWQHLAVSLNTLGAAFDQRGEALKQERPWRHELVDSLVQPALLFSSEGRMLAANDAARGLLGIAIDATDLTVVQAVGSAALVDAVREATQGRGPITVDVQHGARELRAVVSLIGDQTLLIITDRTQERRVEELRRNFVVNASHELKTPVTSIQTLAEALDVTARSDPDRVQPLVNRLNVEAERLARLVGDLLDLRRLEERGPLERTPVDLAEMVRLAAAELIPRAEARDLEISVDAPERAMVVGVPGDLEVVVKNLVANAIQYNRPDGTITISLRSLDGGYVLEVSDTGIGIPQQDLARIFERFYRVDTARSRETGGTGLGLSIVRHAVESHGGTIRVDSLLGEGTTFTVELPIAADH